MNAVSPFFDLDQVGAQICQLGFADIGSSQVAGGGPALVYAVNTSYQATNSPHVLAPNNNVTPGGSSPPAPEVVMPNGSDYVPPKQNILAAQILTMAHNAKIKVGI